MISAICMVNGIKSQKPLPNWNITIPGGAPRARAPTATTTTAAIAKISASGNQRSLQSASASATFASIPSSGTSLTTRSVDAGLSAISVSGRNEEPPRILRRDQGPVGPGRWYTSGFHRATGRHASAFAEAGHDQVGRDGHVPHAGPDGVVDRVGYGGRDYRRGRLPDARSEEHTSELQSR